MLMEQLGNMGWGSWLYSPSRPKWSVPETSEIDTKRGACYHVHYGYANGHKDA